MNRKVMSFVVGLALLSGLNVVARVRLELTQEQKDHAIELVSAILANRVDVIDRHVTSVFPDSKSENPEHDLLVLSVFDVFVKGLLGRDKQHLLENNAGRQYTNIIGVKRMALRSEPEVTGKEQRPVEPEVAR